MTTTPELSDTEFADPELADEVSRTERPTIAALFGQLVDDSRTFATAELAYLKAQAGERASYALPGLAMIGVAMALSFAVIVAGLIGLMVWLATITPLGWAVLIVTATAALVCLILVRVGTARLRGSLKSRDTR